MLIGASIESSTHGAEASSETAVPAIASYAGEYSVSEAEAGRRLARLDAITDVLRSIREIESGRLAGWGIDHEGTFTGWVWLTGNDEPSSGASALADAHADVEIRRGAAHSLQQLLDVQGSFGNGSSVGAIGRVADTSDTTTDYSDIVTFTEVDMTANALHIGIDPALAPTTGAGPTGATGAIGGLATDNPHLIGPSVGTHVGATDAELQTAITRLTAEFAGHIPVAYEIVDGRNIVSDAMFDGGRAMSKCTSGFAARHEGTDYYGLITAGHCDGTIRMHGVSLPWVYGYASVTADAEFRRIPSGSGHELRSQFAYGDQEPLTIRVVRSKADRLDMHGRYVCHQGGVSGVSCGTVTNIHHRPTKEGACRVSSNGDSTTCHSVFVRVYGSSLEACAGDSGGPWFSSSKAYGIHKSSQRTGKCSDIGTYATFSAIDEVEEFLDAEILINKNVIIG
ncbi:MAG: trypsin-like serine protease [Acidimicrobiaceae bacterium]|nr:trypsin-like serine protease [Acidimicrobiaceae bacterium]MCY3949777.1 trypsin-like serine protease [Acidimicrobiaceae bacterium]